jgi:hypothetical protein
MSIRLRISLKFAIPIASLFLFMAVGRFVSPAMAEDTVPHAADVANPPVDRIPPHQRKAFVRQPVTTTDGVLKLDEPVIIKLNDTLLHVPAAYLSPWPQQKVRNRINNYKALNFEFWMPDKRHLEISPLSNVDFRPTEPGRGKPAQNAYIVRVWDVQPIKLDDPGYISPEQAFRNQISSRLRSGSKYSFQEEEFGLVRFWPSDEPSSKFAVEYRHKEGADPQILLDCMVPDRWRVYPACSGRVYLVAEKLALFVVFPREEVSHWHDIIFAARDLYQSWKTSPEP